LRVHRRADAAPLARNFGKNYNDTMAPVPDVLVVGGGIIGLTSAYFLAKAGLRVEVVEKGEPGREASWAGAGIIPPGKPDRAAAAIDKLRAIGSNQFPILTAELKERTGIDPGYRSCGGIEFVQAGDEAIIRLWEAEGVAFARLNERSLRDLEPGYGRAAGVPYHLPGMAQVRNPRHMRALRAACEAAGVTIHAGAGIRMWLDIHGTICGVVLADGRERLAHKLLLAAGAWGEPFLTQLGVRPGVHPVRGQIILYRTSPDAVRQILVVGKEYLVPRGDGLVLAGSTEEPEAGFEKGTTETGINGLQSFARGLIPSLDSATVEATWSGLRPGSPDGLPLLGPVPGHPNVFAAVGHFRAGVQLSVGTAEVVTAWATGQPYPVPIESFRLDRTPDHSYRPTFRS
jgi:glycine oxidase